MVNLVNEDVYSFVAKQTSLTIAQVEQCFKAYATLIKTVGNSFDRPKGMKINLPFIGRFTFPHKYGLKKGQIRNIPSERGSSILIPIVLEEDEPEYDTIKFTFNRTVISDIKNKSKNFYKKDKFDFDNIIKKE